MTADARPALHLLGLPHTSLTRDVTVCAYTAKAHKFVEMMAGLGYRVVTYWPGDCDIDHPLVEHVPAATATEQRAWFGKTDPATLPMLPVWNASDEWWTVTNRRALAEILLRADQRDLILSTAGINHQPVTAGAQGRTACEWGVGYEGWVERFVCFESHAWRHYQYGRWHERVRGDGRWYDTVIPNFFRESEFPTVGKPDPDGFLLYVGRMISRKGIATAKAIADATGRRLVMAGPGARKYQRRKRRLVPTDGGVLKGVDYVGPVGADERADLMRRAHAVLVPTTYIEPFGGVAVEAQMCGTPVIASGFGAFTETVEHGVTGFLFRTLLDAVRGVDDADRLDRHLIRERAVARYSLGAVGPQYDRWFSDLDGLWGVGWGDLSGRNTNPASATM